MAKRVFKHAPAALIWPRDFFFFFLIFIKHWLVFKAALLNGKRIYFIIIFLSFSKLKKCTDVGNLQGKYLLCLLVGFKISMSFILSFKNKRESLCKNERVAFLVCTIKFFLKWRHFPQRQLMQRGFRSFAKQLLTTCWWRNGEKRF